MLANKWNVLLKNPKDILSGILKVRGITDLELFFNPQKPDTFDYKDFGLSKNEMDAALKRITNAKENHETVVIYGDYDVDGICATSLMWQVLHSFGISVFPFVPDRFKDGYGMTKSGVDKILSQYPQTKLIITVDNGIVAYEAISYVKAKGIDIIVTDHHEQDKALEVTAVVHSTKMCGTAVAWALSKYLLNDERILSYLDLVGIATIADQMNLTGINRSFAFHGIQSLRTSTRAGIQALCATSAIDQSKVGSYEIGYIIGPRLNAAGRLAHALEAVRLMCTPKVIQANTIASNLSELNTQRQQITKDVLTKARETGSFDQKIIVVAGEFHEGVIGLAAGKIVEETGRPAIVLSTFETMVKGSARSVNGLNTTKVLREFEHLFINVGGHEMAAGLSMELKNLEPFLDEFQKYTTVNIDETVFVKTLQIDCEISLSDVNLPLAQKISEMEPYGVGNPSPLFLTRDVEIQEIKVIGSTKEHLKLTVGNGHRLGVLMFYAKKWGKTPEVGEKIDMVYSIGENIWNGKSSLELIVRDFSFSKQKNERKTKTAKPIFEAA